MGKQYNKVEKRRRRKAYAERQKLRAREQSKRRESAKKTAG